MYACVYIRTRPMEKSFGGIAFDKRVFLIKREIYLREMWFYLDALSTDRGTRVHNKIVFPFSFSENPFFKWVRGDNLYLIRDSVGGGPGIQNENATSDRQKPHLG